QLLIYHSDIRNLTLDRHWEFRPSSFACFSPATAIGSDLTGHQCNTPCSELGEYRASPSSSCALGPTSFNRHGNLGPEGRRTERAGSPRGGHAARAPCRG